MWVNLYNNMSVRVDPITESGAFDHERYDLENYFKIKDTLLKYLRLEGFDTIPGEYHICLFDMHWFIKVK